MPLGRGHVDKGHRVCCFTKTMLLLKHLVVKHLDFEMVPMFPSAAIVVCRTVDSCHWDAAFTDTNGISSLSVTPLSRSIQGTA